MGVAPCAVAVPRLRADAMRNRERIIAAAGDAFVEHGPDVPLDAIAERAGVGNATVYRNFADREDLLLNVALAALDRIVGHAEASAAEADAFEALRGFVHRTAGEPLGSLCSLLCSSGVDRTDPRVTAARDRLERAVDQVMDRARATGQLRADVARGDLLLAITQLTRPVQGMTTAGCDRFVHRHLQVFLDGLRAPAPSVLSGTAATLEDLQRRDL